MTRAVVFAYHNVGVRCLKVLLAHGVDVPLVRHARGRSAASRSGSTASRRTAAEYGIAAIAPADPNAAELLARVAALPARFPVLVLLPADARRRRCSRCRRAARSTCTARCCRSIAAARR